MATSHAPLATQWPTKFQACEQLLQSLTRLPRPWVFTNGVFDLLHRGHVTYLEQASRLGASLIVALNSDASARQLGKGPSRPINSECDRAWVVAALESVSLVTLFDEPTPLQLLAEVKPDWYVKGGDYDMAQLEETRLMHTWGGQSLAIDYLPGLSSSQIIARIKTGA
ncbi:MAG: D-glycero-beta-D-manno-heptose 1-phosphate adenylyltransferase [Rubrivivax sp.]|nr:MAG: D-glycero-beta-D-manno-heptose 1-phosphate adenylyltransferase [Rubrivivax sp.]